MQELEQQRDQDHGDQPCKHSLVLSNKWGCLLQVRNSFHSSLHVVVRFCWWIGIWLSLAPGSSDSSNIGRDQHECILNSWKQGLKLWELGSRPDLVAFESLVTRQSLVTCHLRSHGARILLWLILHSWLLIEILPQCDNIELSTSSSSS
jgi:hypothetical protein